MGATCATHTGQATGEWVWACLLGGVSEGGLSVIMQLLGDGLPQPLPAAEEARAVPPIKKVRLACDQHVDSKV